MSDDNKPGLQVRLESLGWTFNENAAMGEQWTKTDPATQQVYNQKTQEWLYDFTAAQADQEITRGRALLGIGQDIKEMRRRRQSEDQPTPSQ